MVKITITSGSWVGRTRFFQGERVVENLDPLVLGERVDPSELFAGFLRHRYSWEADYSEATDKEILAWFRVELVARIMRALQDGRVVRFLDQEWSVRKNKNILKVAQQIEDAIVASGRMVTIDADNEAGLVIGVGDWEQ